MGIYRQSKTYCQSQTMKENLSQADAEPIPSKG